MTAPLAAQAATKLCTISHWERFRHAEICRQEPISVQRENPLGFWTSERPNSREGNPSSTGNQARKDLIESEPLERESAKAGNLESTEEIGTGNGLIESETQQHKRNTERK
ncbi:hypothetical protein, partial [Streptomyces candidus]|uniref:hypothetical protein n=1 Tax=Streptomyces candidus TaxID=67283 RepID=UPI001E59604F